MAYLWTQGKSIGNNDPNVSPFLKTWIAQNGIVVCGVTGAGTAKEVQANWDSPFEGESVGSKFQKAGGLLQTATDVTSITTFQSRQVWGGNRPIQFNVVFQLYALSDPQTEVINPLIELEKMASPQVNSKDPGNLIGAGDVKLGRVPGTVSINIGRNAIYPQCVIGSISEPLDKEVNSDGLLIRAEVNLSIQTLEMVNRSEVASKFG